MILPAKIKASLTQIDTNMAVVLNHIISTQDNIIKDLNNLKALMNNVNDGLLQKVLINQEKTSKNHNELSVKLDRIVSCGPSCETKSTQRRSKLSKKTTTTTRLNKLTWVKEQYEQLGWKFWDDIVENAEEEVAKILDDTDNKEDLKKKSGKAKIQKEAALIYNTFKNNVDIQNWINNKFDEYKETLQKNEDVDKTAERDEVSE